MIFHLEDDVQLLASNEQGASTAKVNQQIRQIPPPPPSNQGLLRTAGDKAKLYVREKVVNIFSYEDALHMYSYVLADLNSVSPLRQVQKERQSVDIVTLIHLPGSRVERYLGHLNFFFIRESTSIREVTE